MLLLLVMGGLMVGCCSGMFGDSGAQCDLGCKAGTLPVFRDNAVHPVVAGNKALQFSANGCGTDEIKVHTADEILPCCTVHDACYSICGIDRDFCDSEFTKCIERQCGTIATTAGRQECLASKQTLSMGVMMFGCGAFRAAQQAMCECGTADVRSARLSSLVHNRLYASSTDKTVEEVEAIATRISDAKPKSGAVLVHRVLEKYNQTLIAVASAQRDEL